jgi:hypothetical protein
MVHCLQHSYTLAHVLKFFITAQENPPNKLSNVKPTVEIYLLVPCRMWLGVIWSSLDDYKSSGGHLEILIGVEFWKGAKVEKVTSKFKYIIHIMILQTHVNLPDGDLCEHSVLSGTLMTDRMSCSCWYRIPSYYQSFGCAKL